MGLRCRSGVPPRLTGGPIMSKLLSAISIGLKIGLAVGSLIFGGCVQSQQPVASLASPSLYGKVAVVDAVVAARYLAQPALPDDLGDSGSPPAVVPPVAVKQ